MTSSRQSDPPRTGLILGVERSGSTWLSNLLDSAPEAETFMEPLARVAGIFESIPGRLEYLDEDDLERWDFLAERFDDLSELKYHGAEWPGAPGWLRALNWRGHEWLSGAVGSLLPSRSRSAVQAYSELNFNRRDNPRVQRFASTSSRQLRLFKFLRLNTKARLVDRLFPGATVTVILRNPIAQCRSIVRRMNQGSLVELDAVFETLPEALRRHPRLEPFGEAFEQCPQDTEFARAIAFWFVNYSVLLEDLEDCDLDVQTLRYESLCETPESTTRRVFEHHGLELGPQTEAYLEHSTSGDTGAASATNTSRDSSTYYRRQLEQLSRESVERFWQVAGPFWNLAPNPVRHYETWLDRMIGPQR